MSREQRYKTNRELLKRFIPYFYKYKWLLLADLLAASLTTVCELVLPLIVRRITNGAMGNAGALTSGLVLRMGTLYILLRIIDAGANYFMQSEGHIMGAKIETDMRHDLFHHLQQLSFHFYSNTKVGQIMSRLTSDLFDITEFAHHAPENFLISGIKVIIAFIILSGMNVWLTLLIFAVLPFMIYFTRYFNKLMRQAGRECRHQVGEINAQAEDTLLGIRVVKSFSNEKLEENKFDEGNKEFLRLKRRRYHYMAGFGTSTRIHDGLMYIIVVVAGALFLIRGKIGVGDYTAYLLYVSTLLNSIRVIVDSTEMFQNGMTGIERFCEIMDTPAEIKDSPNAAALQNVRGEICFEKVGFHYSDDEEHQVLSNIDLHVMPGNNVAVVGPSGGGKTTLCNLIPRFYDVTDGRITIDGQDIRNITLESLRRNIGMVQQDVYMFSGTVAENIAYGKPDASREEIEEAARQADADGFIRQLPNGYDTYVGERGVKLSGGQKQRISIARVFLKNPPILILDEATSALDNESERVVQHSLEKLALGRTTFTIAHRLTTIRNASTIWVLTEKGIEEQGSHKELISKGGLYSQLYAMYTEENAS